MVHEHPVVAVFKLALHDLRTGKFWVANVEDSTEMNIALLGSLEFHMGDESFWSKPAVAARGASQVAILVPG